MNWVDSVRNTNTKSMSAAVPERIAKTKQYLTKARSK